MPRTRAVLSRPTRQERAQQRRGLGKLSQRQVADATRARYQAACAWFFRWMRAWSVPFPADPYELDDRLCQCIDQAWEEGESYSFIGDLLSGLGTFVPRLRHQMPAAWRLFGAWRRLELPCRAWPLTKAQVQALAYVCLDWGCWDVGLALLLAFHAVLRTHEAIDARVGQFTWSTSGLQAHLSLPETKGTARKGAIEGVSITCPALVACLICMSSQLQPGDRLLRRSPAQFRSCFSKAVSMCGLEGVFKPYSCRRGGATTAFRSHGSLDYITDRGRWGNTRTARIYINTALADLQSQAQSPETNQRIECYSSALRTVVQHWLRTKWGLSGSTWTLV